MAYVYTSIRIGLRGVGCLHRRRAGEAVAEQVFQRELDQNEARHREFLGSRLADLRWLPSAPELSLIHI